MRCHSGDFVVLKDGRRGSILKKRGSSIEVGVFHEPESETMSAEDVAEIVNTRAEREAAASEQMAKNWNDIVNG